MLTNLKPQRMHLGLQLPAPLLQPADGNHPLYVIRWICGHLGGCNKLAVPNKTGAHTPFHLLLRRLRTRCQLAHLARPGIAHHVLEQLICARRAARRQKSQRVARELPLPPRRWGWISPCLLTIRHCSPHRRQQLLPALLAKPCPPPRGAGGTPHTAMWSGTCR